MTAPAEPRPRFRQGQRVRVASRPSVGHCRTPMYLRGQPATVIALAGRFANPEELAYHQPGLPPIPLYRVRFRHDDLWPDFRGNPGDELEADIFEHWLDPADEELRT